MLLVLSDKPRKRGTICGRGKWYSPLTDTTYNFQSSYEREFMNFLDSHRIKWIKNKERYSYIRDGKEHKYIPDFYLPDLNMYIEVKGFTRKSDPLKFEAFPEDKNLVLLLYEDMKRLGCKVFNPKLTEGGIDNTKWPMTVLGNLDEWQEPGELSPELKKRVSSDKFFKALEDLSCAI